MAKYTYNNEPISEEFVIEAAGKNDLDVFECVGFGHSSGHMH